MVRSVDPLYGYVKCNFVKVVLFNSQAARLFWLGNLPASPLTVWGIKQGWFILDAAELKKIIGFVVLITVVGMLTQSKLSVHGQVLI